MPDTAVVGAPRTEELTPSGPCGGAPDAGTGTFGVLTYNILAGGGPRLGAIERTLRQSGADVVGLQEVLRPDLLARLAGALGMHHAVARSPSGWHIGALSRWPVLEVRQHAGPQLARALLELLVELPSGGRLRLFVIHLRASFSEQRAGEARRLRELAFALERMQGARSAGEPHLLVGDFNSLAPGERLLASRVMRHALAVDAARHRLGHGLDGHASVDFILPRPARPLRPLLDLASRAAPLAGLLDALVGLYVPRSVVRRLRGAGYVDCYAALRPDPRTRAFTCPVPLPAGRIDYIFASPDLASRLVCCDILTGTPDRPVSRASDHLPVLARFRLGD